MKDKDIRKSALDADVVSRARAASPITDPGEVVGGFRSRLGRDKRDPRRYNF